MTHLLTRMEPYYTLAQRAVAERILDHLARSAMPTTFDALVEKVGRHPDQSRDEPEVGDVVDLLDSDHYLRRSGDSYEWRYPVLRQIWAHRGRLRP